MLDHLVVALVVRSLLQTEILAVLALACTASEMDEQVVQLLQSQSQLDIHTACMGYQQLYKLHRFVRLKLEEELQSICIGPSSRFKANEMAVTIAASCVKGPLGRRNDF